MYRSSHRAARGFCSRCGSTITFSYENEPDQIWLTAGSLDHPEQIVPTAHFMAEHRLPWVPFDLKDPVRAIG